MSERAEELRTKLGPIIRRGKILGGKVDLILNSLHKNSFALTELDFKDMGDILKSLKIIVSTDEISRALENCRNYYFGEVVLNENNQNNPAKLMENREHFISIFNDFSEKVKSYIQEVENTYNYYIEEAERRSKAA